MIVPTFAVPVLAGLLILSAAAGVFAAGSISAEDAVAARQAAMKQDGRALHNSMALTGQDAIAVLQTVHDNYSKLPELFIPNSITDKSEAKPIIWQQFDQFSAIFKKGADAAAAGIVAAKAGDTAGYQAAIKTIAMTCDSCHDTYREKKDD